jgi:putative glutamine amidotransferase
MSAQGRTLHGRCPVIGITARRILRDGTLTPIDGLYPDYCASVALAGGAPVLIPAVLGEPALRRIYERLDGILFPGGVDVAPARFGQEPHPDLGTVDLALDEVELLLARWALEDRLPILGICRGIQLLNVAAGGTLYQDIPALIPGAIAHACPDQPDAHSVVIEAGCRLSVALGATACRTNSRHHQAVQEVAPGMVVTARCSDGVIEGLEMPKARFIVGVQWHPENLAATSAQMLGLFRAFVEACD